LVRVVAVECIQLTAMQVLILFLAPLLLLVVDMEVPVVVEVV
jgi:hypothetical protein